MNKQVAARVDEPLHDRIEEVCDRYDLTESALVRHCLKNGLDAVEADGLDAIVREETDTVRA